MEFTNPDRARLKELARVVADIAEHPDNEMKRGLWKKHNNLSGEKPLVFVHPDGAWEELLPHAELKCEGEWARSVEYTLKQRIIRNNVIRDDVPIERSLGINQAVISINRGWGLVPERAFSSEDGRGAWQFKPVVHSPSDWRKLRKPAIEVDENATRERFKQTMDLLGDVLDVSLRGVTGFDFHVMHLYCDLRR